MNPPRDKEGDKKTKPPVVEELPETGAKFVIAFVLVVYLLMLTGAWFWVQGWPWEPDCSEAHEIWRPRCYDTQGNVIGGE